MDQTLIKKGRNVSLDLLTAQGRTALAAAKKNAVALAERDWSEEKSKELMFGLDELETVSQRTAQKRRKKLASTRNEVDAARAARDLISESRLALALLEKQGVKLPRNLLKGKTPLSTASLGRYLGETAAAIKPLDEKLKGPLGGRIASEEFENAKLNLDAADEQQELARRMAPAQTAALNEKKGHVLVLLEELRLAARLAFKGDKATLAQFELDILKRGRKSKSAAKKVAKKAVKREPEAEVE